MSESKGPSLRKIQQSKTSSSMNQRSCRQDEFWKTKEHAPPLPIVVYACIRKRYIASIDGWTKVSCGRLSGPAGNDTELWSEIIVQKFHSFYRTKMFLTREGCRSHVCHNDMAVRRNKSPGYFFSLNWSDSKRSTPSKYLTNLSSTPILKSKSWGRFWEWM